MAHLSHPAVNAAASNGMTKSGGRGKAGCVVLGVATTCSNVVPPSEDNSHHPGMAPPAVGVHPAVTMVNQICPSCPFPKSVCVKMPFVAPPP